MGLEWFEYYLLTNSTKGLKKEIEALKSEVCQLKEEIEKIKTEKAS